MHALNDISRVRCGSGMVGGRVGVGHVTVCCGVIAARRTSSKSSACSSVSVSMAVSESVSVLLVGESVRRRPFPCACFAVGSRSSSMPSDWWRSFPTDRSKSSSQAV
jgi:hypothetical protein